MNGHRLHTTHVGRDRFDDAETACIHFRSGVSDVDESNT